jgi:hypothetical protein
MAVARQDSENMRNSEALTNLKLALETFHAEQSAAADAQHALLQRELAAANVRTATAHADRPCAHQPSRALASHVAALGAPPLQTCEMGEWTGGVSVAGAAQGGGGV